MTTSSEPMATSSEPMATSSDPMATSGDPMATSGELMATSSEPEVAIRKRVVTAGEGRAVAFPVWIGIRGGR